MKRTNWLWLALFVVLGGGNQARADDKAAARPNVLFIAVDDLRDWIGVLGERPDVKTPNFDRLAAQSMLFTRAYCAAPACNPSRAALMTSIRPSTSGVYHNSQPWRPVLSDKATMSQHFMAAGYDVRAAGKIYHGSKDGDLWTEYVSRGEFPHPKQRGTPAKAGHFDWGAVDEGDEAMGDTHSVEYGIRQINTPKDKPFFLAVGFIKPHLPFYAPQKYFDLYPLADVKRPKVLENDLDDVPPAGVRMARPDGDHKLVVETGEWEHALQSYLACISYVDGQLGRLLDALEASPHAKNTIIVLWSDHGWNLGEKEHWRKFALWEETTRVVLMASVPGVSKNGQRCDQPVSLIDLYPTLIELCGLEKPAHRLEGESLVPLLKDPGAARKQPAITTEGRENHAVRTAKWRYIRYADGSEELYDMQADPLQWKNVANDPQHASAKAELAALLPRVNAADAPHEREGKEKPAAKKPAGKSNSDQPKKKNVKKSASK